MVPGYLCRRDLHYFFLRNKFAVERQAARTRAVRIDTVEVIGSIPVAPIALPIRVNRQIPRESKQDVPATTAGFFAGTITCGQ